MSALAESAILFRTDEFPLLVKKLSKSRSAVSRKLAHPCHIELRNNAHCDQIQRLIPSEGAPSLRSISDVRMLGDGRR